MKGSTTTKAEVSTNRSDINSLLRLSTQIGRDPLLVHASSGNTSLKIDGTLWVKASGKWLAYADQEEILVPVEISECLTCLKESRPLPWRNEDAWASHLRPSIETFMHAVLPQRFVIHVHSVHTISLAVRADAPAQLAERLSGLRWQWIPFVASGLPLARKVLAASSIRPDTDVFILGNHGLVVCGEDCGAAESLLFEVERRLASRPRPVAKPKSNFLEGAQCLSRWHLPDLEVIHALGTDLVARRIFKGGVLYPCQAIFLGRTLPLLPSAGHAFDLTRRIENFDAAPPFLIVEDGGVLVNDHITAAEYAVLQGFAEVVRRVETSAPIRYLTDCEVSSALGADGMQYRMSAENSVKLSIARLEGNCQWPREAPSN
jgi:rhamnose utilization protein RhaD (predicted bifunctional aldolase and dehydrogenase)